MSSTECVFKATAMPRSPAAWAATAVPSGGSANATLAQRDQLIVVAVNPDHQRQGLVGGLLGQEKVQDLIAVAVLDVESVSLCSDAGRQRGRAAAHTAAGHLSKRRRRGEERNTDEQETPRPAR
jgi:hypothetical protein